MEESETREKWRARIEPLIEEDLIRKEGETQEVHLKRMFELKSEAQEMAPEILSVVCKTFNLREPSEEDFKEVNYLQLKGFIFDALDLADIPADDFQSTNK